MIDFDIYVPSQRVENLMQSLRMRIGKDYHTTKVYISTASHNDNWIRKMFNNTKLTEEEKCEKQ